MQCINTLKSRGAHFLSNHSIRSHLSSCNSSAITVTMLSSRFAYLSLVLCAVRFVNASNPAPPSPQLLRRHLHQPASSLTCLTTPRSGALTISSNSTSPTQSSQHQSFGAAIITGPASHPMPYIVRIRLQEALPQSGC